MSDILPPNLPLWLRLGFRSFEAGLRLWDRRAARASVAPAALPAGGRAIETQAGERPARDMLQAGLVVGAALGALGVALWGARRSPDAAPTSPADLPGLELRGRPADVVERARKAAAQALAQTERPRSPYGGAQ